MNTFFKTFFMCMLLTLGFLTYKYFYVESNVGNLTVTKNNPVFGTHPNLPEAKPIENKPSVETGEKKEEVNKVEPKKEATPSKVKYLNKCYFYSNDGKLILVERELNFKPSIENSIAILLKGPLISETKKGVYSEIPANVDLISVKRTDKDVIVNLSSNFGNGGGTKSITDRVAQVSKTVKIHEPGKNIFLYINGKEVEYLGGDGVYIKQPLD